MEFQLPLVIGKLVFGLKKIHELFGKKLQKWLAQNWTNFSDKFPKAKQIYLLAKEEQHVYLIFTNQIEMENYKSTEKLDSNETIYYKDN